ncbi:MAG: flavodoxin [Cellvibrionaceae bacterium]
MNTISDMNVGLIFGTDTGNTEEIGDKIAGVLVEHACPVEMINVVDATPEIIESFDFIIMGIPTWDFGGIQEDWENFEDEILATKLDNKIVALYGLGDQRGYGDYFIDAVGWLHERVLKTGATIIGEWPTEGYDFEASLAANEDKSYFCGLAIDEDQQIELTDGRIEGWINLLIEQLNKLDAVA